MELDQKPHFHIRQSLADIQNMLPGTKHLLKRFHLISYQAAKLKEPRKMNFNATHRHQLLNIYSNYKMNNLEK
jgi:hypothetical protein